jgi:Ran GTPase-activating protein (RanGAP) involved in mRNA processing and transport
MLVTCVCTHAISDGLRELNIAFNPIGDDGVRELCQAFERTSSLQKLNLQGCQINEFGGELLQAALANNVTIVELNVSENNMSEEQQAFVMAEVEANDVIKQIKKDAMFVNADELPTHVSTASDAILTLTTS